MVCLRNTPPSVIKFWGPLMSHLWPQLGLLYFGSQPNCPLIQCYLLLQLMPLHLCPKEAIVVIPGVFNLVNLAQVRSLPPLGHTIDKCWNFLGRLACTAKVAQVIPLALSELSTQSTKFHVAYADFLKQFEESRDSSSIASIAHMGNSYACLSRTSFIGSWILDSNATNNVSSNKSGCFCLVISLLLS